MNFSVKDTHVIDLHKYLLNDFELLINEKPKLILAESIQARIKECEDFVLKKSEEDVYIYGVNTGFGSLCEKRVDSVDMEKLQYNHVVSHACGVGEYVSEDISRLTLFIKLLTFRTGHTGISLNTVNRLLDFWNAGVIPAIPKKGTVGASGDLAPLAHMALPLLGMGKVHYRDNIVDTKVILSKFGWEPIKLKPKEGLALTNGVQYINAHAIYSLIQCEKLTKAADIIASMSIQGFSCANTFYNPLYHTTSLHNERKIIAENLSKMLSDSNHYTLTTCNHSKQDPYSFRCIPQVHGAIRQVYNNAKIVMENECNGVSDNPLFFPKEGQVLFGGNLHGESTAFMLDFLAIAISELANISERRTYQLLSGRRGLPDFLINDFGLNSGFMVAQYTSAALVNENKVFSTPASIDSIPTCQLQEDHVSMGGTSAYKLCEIINNTIIILSIELLIATQAIEYNNELILSSSCRKILDEYRKDISLLEKDRIIAEDIESSRKFLLKNLKLWGTLIN